MNYLTRFWAAACLLLALYYSAQAQTLPFDRAMTCASGDGNYGWGPTYQTLDAQGNLYVAGSYQGTVMVGGTILTNAPTTNFLAKIDPAGNYRWVTPLSDGQTPGIGINRLAVDGQGDVYATGSFATYSAIVGAGGPVLYNSSVRSDAFVGKFSGATGRSLWARRAGGVGSDSFGPLAVTLSGDVYAVCNNSQIIHDTLDFGPFSLPRDISNVFLTKLTTNGTWLWARPIANTSRGYSMYVKDIALDNQGAIYMGGGFNDSVTFGNNILYTRSISGTSSGKDEFFVAKTTDTGNWLWAVQGDALTHQNLAYAEGLALDQSGHVYLTGGYKYTNAHFGSITLPNQSSQVPPWNPQSPPYPNEYYTDAFVARLNAATGAWEWASRNGTANTDVAIQPIVDAQGRLYVTGIWTGTAARELGQLDATTGQWLTTRALPGEWLCNVVIDSQSRLYIAGSFSDQAPLVLGSTILAPDGPGRGTGYLARLAANPLPTRPPVAARDFQVWPNPHRDGPVWVQGPPAGQIVQLLDVLGRVLTQAPMPAAGPLALPRPSALPAGLYLVRSGQKVCRLVME